MQNTETTAVVEKQTTGMPGPDWIPSPDWSPGGKHYTEIEPDLERPRMKGVPTAYLAGPIHAANQEQRDGWREEARELLEKRGWLVVNPVGKVGWKAEDIVEVDLQLISVCDAVIAWVPHGIESFGTAMEIFYASRVCKIRVYAWGRNERYAPAWLVATASVWPELQDVISEATGE